jgi:hypothetical protein
MGDAPQPQLNAVGAANASGVEEVGKLIGGVVSGAADVEGIIALAQLLLSQNDLGSLSDALQNAFRQLGAGLRAENIITRRTNQVNALSEAQMITDDLKNLVFLQPPLTPAERHDKIETCDGVIHKLSPRDPLWVAPFNDQIFWTDAGVRLWWLANLGGSDPTESDFGYGVQAPTPDATGAVFNYFYILPAYTEALCMFLMVGTALLQEDFIKQFADTVVRPAANDLKDRHDEILNGIRLLSPGHWDGQNLMATLFTLSRFGYGTPRGITPVLPPTALLPKPQPVLFPAALGGVNIEYGAVEIFSGYSAIDLYKITFQDIEAMPALDDSPFNKFQIRVLKRAKAVYIGVGLLAVWQNINSLKALLGDPLLKRPNFADWSFRNDLIKTAKISPKLEGFYLTDLARFLRNTLPHDTGEPQLKGTSFRALLA